MYAKIQPVPSFGGPATILSINSVNVQPGSSATYQWVLENDARAPLTNGGIYLTGDAYSQWGTDDDYLYTYAANFLGLTIIEIVPDAPPAPPAPVDVPAPVVAPSDEPAPADGGAQ